jgi:hypothetical protein
LIYSVSAPGHGDGRTRLNFEWVAVIAAVNVLVSAIILYKFQLELRDFAWHLPGKIGALAEQLGIISFPAKPKTFAI